MLTGAETGEADAALGTASTGMGEGAGAARGGTPSPSVSEPGRYSAPAGGGVKVDRRGPGGASEPGMSGSGRSSIMPR